MRTLTEAIEKVKETLESKGMKYGKTYVKVGQAFGERPQFTILVRMFEKCFRALHILDRSAIGNKEVDKFLTQEFLDIACYAILAMFESSVEDEQPIHIWKDPKGTVCGKPLTSIAMNWTNDPHKATCQECKEDYK